jgi:hypothetical protein
MTDNSDVQYVADGTLRDARIETMLMLIEQNDASDPAFDKLFNELMHEFVSTDAPLFRFSEIIDRSDAVGITYLVLLGVDFEVCTPESARWPDFDQDGDFVCAVSIYYPGYDDETGIMCTDFMPGRTINAAVALALLQFAREVNEERFAEPQLPLFLN